MTAILWASIAVLLPAFLVLALEPEWCKVAGMVLLLLLGIGG